ncbi:GAP family protein [Kitasatospora mediocidica]|uniref:GAP family protein n=1 Tax=Kitasatospora mediocidica TaxID=58352 RepID=UPI000560822E|nr:GAP family protein [Kitasatospora mediocidica]
MGNAIGQMLASAVGIAISPIPVIAIVLMLATARGRANGVAFTLAWVLTLGVVSTVVVLAGDGGGAHTTGGPATWTSWVKLALGALFVLLGVKQWTGRPKEGQAAELPGWMRTIDSFSPGKAAGLAVVLAGLNPKNLVLAVGGALSIASSTAGAGGKTVATVLLVLIGSLCTLLPLGVYLLGGERAAGTLQSWKTWMAAHNGAIMTVLLLVLGAKYVGDALSALTG